MIYTMYMYFEAWFKSATKSSVGAQNEQPHETHHGLNSYQ